MRAWTDGVESSGIRSGSRLSEFRNEAKQLRSTHELEPNTSITIQSSIFVHRESSLYILHIHPLLNRFRLVLRQKWIIYSGKIPRLAS